MLEELQRIADSLAAGLQRSVAIDDPQHRLLVHTSHHGETVDRHRVESIMDKTVGQNVIDWIRGHGIATATVPVRIEPNEQLGVVARVCVPVRSQGILLAYLWLLDADGSVSGADLEQAMASADTAGGVLFREQLLGDIRRGRERELLRDLLSSDAAVREHAAAQLVDGDRLPADGSVVVLALDVTDGGPGADDVAVELALHRVASRLLPLRAISTSRSGAGGVLLVGGRSLPGTDRLRAVAEALCKETADVLGDGATVRVGIGPVVSSVAESHQSHRGAQDALRVAALVPGFSAIASWDELGIYRLLVQLPLEQLRDNAVPPGLLRLVEADESGQLVQTLEVYLDEAGRVPATIDLLKIHRTSLYYRLNKIEQLTGMDLSRGGDRLALHLGIKLARLIDLT